MSTKKEEHAQFTKKMQERRRSRADKPFYPREIYYNTQATIDTIRHFVNGYGDVNPLYRDPEYAKKTKYGTVIAPPCFLFSIQWVGPGAGGAGIHGWYSGGQWQWFRPVNEGDEIHAVCCLRELVEKKGKMGGGKTWLDYSEPIYVNQKGEIVYKSPSIIVSAQNRYFYYNIILVLYLHQIFLFPDFPILLSANFCHELYPRLRTPRFPRLKHWLRLFLRRPALCFFA